MTLRKRSLAGESRKSLRKDNSDGEARLARRLAKLAPIPREFYGRDVVSVSRDILGKVLIREDREQVRAARIVEVEAYLGITDPAAHAAAGKTARNFVLFGPPGHAYVYFIYGNHYCLNVSCEPEGQAGCLLVRALEPLAGIEFMVRSRGMDGSLERPSQQRLLTSGPGRLAEAFDITRTRDNNKDVTSRTSDLRIVDDGFRPEKIGVTPRIGITKAAHEELRFVIVGNAFVSGKRL